MILVSVKCKPEPLSHSIVLYQSLYLYLPPVLLQMEYVPRSNIHNTLLYEYFVNKSIFYLCRQFYTLGWLTGTGGAISVKYG